MILSLLNAFENAKRVVDPDDNKPVTVQLNTELFRTYQHRFGSKLENSIKLEHKEKVRIRSGMLRMSLSIVLSCFAPVVTGIVGTVRELLNKPEMNGITKIVMVGGFSDSAVLQKAVRDELGGRYTIMTPEDAWCSVMKGAVMFGHEPHSIFSRRAKMTYGIAETVPFNVSKHSRDSYDVVDGKFIVKNVFRLWVKRGEELRTITKKCEPSNPDMSEIILSVYATDGRVPDYVTEDDVYLVGRLRVEVPGRGTDRRVEVTMRFGGTTVEVEACDMRNYGRKFTASLDFLL